MLDLTSNIKLAHHDDGKKKYQSHEVFLKEDDFYYNQLFSHNIFEARGYGATKEEALNDLKNKLNFLFDELKILEQKLFESKELENNMVEVNCFDKEIVIES